MDHKPTTMTTRREFLKTTSVLAVGSGLAGSAVSALAADGFVSLRPAPAKRTFTSVAVDKKIAEIKALIADPEVGWLFENCYPNTLDTTVDFEVIDGKPDTFVITGDIDAMWLRDSTRIGACYTLRELLSPEGMVLAIQNSLPMKGWRLRMLYNEAIDEEINPLHGDCIELPSRADALQAFVGSGDTPLSDNC